MSEQIFVGLHNHSDVGSLQDSIMSADDIITTTKKLGMNAVAITDHGSCAAWLQFKNSAKKHNIKPIFGIEGYFVDDIHDIYKNNQELELLENTIKILKKEKKKENQVLIKTYEDDIAKLKEIRKNLSKYNHLILLAKNYQGMMNIMKIHNEAVIDGFFRYPRFDWAILEKYQGGIIASSACLGSRISKLLTVDNINQAQIDLARFQSIFGKENFYLELQLHDIVLQTEVNHKMIALAHTTNTKMSVTCDAHYAENGMGKTRALIRQLDKEVDEVNDDSNLNDLYIKNDDMLIDCWRKYMIGSPIEILQEAIKNTRKIADSIEDFDFDSSLKFPNFESGELTQEEFLKEKTFEGLKRKGLDTNPEYVKRLEYELDTINTLGFASYFNVVSNMVLEAKKSQSVGCGRGSAGGSLTSYCTGITEIDPLEYGLFFERFLNKEKGILPATFGQNKNILSAELDIESIENSCVCGEHHE